jgi:tetratricopeptide (TPR) repeat protein
MYVLRLRILQRFTNNGRSLTKPWSIIRRFSACNRNMIVTVQTLPAPLAVLVCEPVRGIRFILFFVSHYYFPLLSDSGYIRHQKGDYDGALEINQECLRLRRETKGDMDEDVAATLTHIALVLLKMERHDIALEVLTEAYRIRKVICKPSTRDLAFTLYNIALIHHHQGSHEQALAFYLETARVEKAALGQAHKDLSITYYNIGQIYYQRGEMKAAIQKFRQALEIEKKCFGAEHPTCARTLNEIGNIELQVGNIEEVMTCYTEALRIYNKAGMDDDRLVVYGVRLWRFGLVQPEAAAMA